MLSSFRGYSNAVGGETIKTFVKGALILTAASLFTRVLGFVYRIYMSNLIGAEGMGLYQLIMPIYTLTWSITSSGLSTTISKLVSQENAKKEYGNMGRVLKQSVLISAILSVAIGAVLYFLADFISGNILHESRTMISLKILALCIPFMAAGSCIRGYFYGLQQPVVPAISQVMEQITRMAVIFLIAGFFIPMGLEYAAAAATIGIVAGEILSFIYVFIAYYLFKRKKSFVKRPSMSVVASLSAIFAMAMPLTLNRVTGSLLSTFENILIPQKLVEFGNTPDAALSSFGQLTGMAMPLVMFPSAFLVALAITLVPEISSAQAMNNTKKIQFTISKSLLFAVLVGIGAAATFLIFPYEIGYSIYRQTEIGAYLFKLAIFCPFIYFQMVLAGILNGLGEQVFLFRNSLIASVITILFIFFFIPKIGIDAFLIGWIIALIIVTYLCIKKIEQTVKLKFDPMVFIVKPALCAAATGLFMRYVGYKFVFSKLGNHLAGTLTMVLFIAAIYLLLLIFSGCISKKDLKLMSGK